MPAPRKYPIELKERATRLAVDARRDANTRRGAIARIAGQLDIHPEALRGWVRWAEAAETGPDTPRRGPGTPPVVRTGPAGGGEVVGPVSDRQRILELEAKNRELTRANTILRQAAAFFRSGARPRTSLKVQFVTSSAGAPRRARSRADLRGAGRDQRRDRSRR